MSILTWIQRVFRRSGARRPTSAKQHLHNKLGNTIGERKHEMFVQLRTGATPETAVNRFLVDIRRDLLEIVDTENRNNAQRASGERRVIRPGATPDVHTIEESGERIKPGFPLS